MAREFTFAKPSEAVITLHDEAGVAHQYRVRATTRATLGVLATLRSVSAEMKDKKDISEADLGRSVEAHIKFAGVKLEALNDDGPDAATLLLAAWENNEAGVEDFIALTEFLSDDDGEDVPPTTEPTNGSTTSHSDTSPVATEPSMM